jgi:hypothetical protein
MPDAATQLKVKISKLSNGNNIKAQALMLDNIERNHIHLKKAETPCR